MEHILTLKTVFSLSVFQFLWVFVWGSPLLKWKYCCSWSWPLYDQIKVPNIDGLASSEVNWPILNSLALNIKYIEQLSCRKWYCYASIRAAFVSASAQDKIFSPLPSLEHRARHGRLAALNNISTIMTWIIRDRSYFCKPINLLRHRRLVGGQPLLSLSMYRVNGQNRRGSQKIDVNKTWYLKNWKDLREIFSTTLFSKFWILFINLIAEVWAANSDHRSYSVNGDIQTNQTFPSPYLDFVFIHHGHNS